MRKYLTTHAPSEDSDQPAHSQCNQSSVGGLCIDIPHTADERSEQISRERGLISVFAEAGV